jgi:DNA polymerase-3 subunit gamma/tau
VEKFIVSARKYRPQNFATVVGQQHITTTLKNAILHNTLAHAFLFCGPRGVGKTTCARILAKTINCENLQPDGEACNTCPSCVSFNDGASLNIHELDAASNNSVDDIRELVTQVRFAPQEGKYKVYIIDEVHMLSQAAFNAFLKTLEEPPSYAKFILATTEKHKILPTILSRCQIFDFKRITNADTVLHLQEIAGKEHINAEKAALQLIAQKSEGCMRDSLSILDKIVSFTNSEVSYANTLEHLNLLDEDYYFKLLEALLKQDLASALLLYDKINRKGFEGDIVLNGFADCLRNLMVCKDARAAELLDVLEGMQEKYVETAKSVSLSYLVSGLNVLSDAETGFRQARNKRLHVELCLIKLCYLQQAIELATNSDGQVLKKKRVDGPVAYKTTPVETIYIKPETIAAPPQKEAGLRVQTAAEPIKAKMPEAPAPAQPELPKQSEARKVIVPPPTEMAPASSENRRPGLLDKLRDQQQQAKATREVKEIMPPDMEAVKAIWEKYAEGLKEQQKHSAVTSFQLAELHIEGNTIYISCQTGINQKFIESEATSLLELFKARFHNPEVAMAFMIAESQEGEKEIEPRFLNSQERYRLMAEQYPMVKELKERLKLQLKY